MAVLDDLVVASVGTKVVLGFVVVTPVFLVLYCVCRPDRRRRARKGRRHRGPGDLPRKKQQFEPVAAADGVQGSVTSSADGAVARFNDVEAESSGSDNDSIIY